MYDLNTINDTQVKRRADLLKMKARSETVDYRYQSEEPHKRPKQKNSVQKALEPNLRAAIAQIGTRRLAPNL